ncbi:cyclic-di-AMP receptor [Evansella sp. AB-P1]|uniref:cyclic-di-AMP receptor n=1 Tax=Evansella sp. AB-P1 TaxID=3037653 RepID=UPI00241D06C6|nr:cyclic-di-AMP receptor [Evansella sp. AB-P1]MDG5786282.1 cyclic-di-AMP receptor [Evansella sp. AB-P1]
MKLMVCVVHNRYAEKMEEQLKGKGYRMTELASSGGFLKKGNTTFLFGLENEDVGTLKEEMKKICLKVEEKKGKLKHTDSRFTSFVICVKDVVPLLSHLK